MLGVKPKKMKKRFDVKRKSSQLYKVGELVLCPGADKSSKEISRKVGNYRFGGPYKIHKVLGIVIYGINGLFKILPTRGICNLRGLARVGYYLEWVVLNNPRMPYNVLSNIPQFLDNDIIDEILLPMGYER
jgi:hypothetical protein